MGDCNSVGFLNLVSTHAMLRNDWRSTAPSQTCVRVCMIFGLNSLGPSLGRCVRVRDITSCVAIFVSLNSDFDSLWIYLQIFNLFFDLFCSHQRSFQKDFHRFKKKKRSNTTKTPRHCDAAWVDLYYIWYNTQLTQQTLYICVQIADLRELLKLHMNFVQMRYR